MLNGAAGTRRRGPRLAAAIGMALLLFARPAPAGWKEANAALQSGQLATALPHLRALAEAGDAEAQYMMGYLLSGASGVKHDLLEAFKWYTIALAQGQANAGPARAMIGKKLGQYRAAEGQRQAMSWLRKYSNEKYQDTDTATDEAADGKAPKDAPLPREKPKNPS